MEYYSEISKLVDSALVGNRQDALKQIQNLINILTDHGDTVAAKGLSNKLSGNIKNTISTQSVFNKPIPVEKDNRFSLADRTLPQENESIVFLSAEKELEIRSFIEYILKQDKLAEVGIPSNPTLLLYGIPGTGKSQLAKYIASKLDMPLITARADALISSYLGSTSKNIRSLLEYANSEPCVLFLDEFDAIAKARDDKNEIGELKRVVVSLLQNIDSLKNTILIAATNHQHLLDPAVWRRFHYKMELSKPDIHVRSSLINHLLINFSIDEEDVIILSKLSDDLTGAEIEMIIYDYLRYIVINDINFNSTDISQRILKSKFVNLTFNSDERKQELDLLHEYDKNLFTYRLLATIFGISSSYVGKILKGKNK